MANNFVAGSAIVRLIYGLNGAVCFNVLGAVKPSNTVINQALANALGSAIKTAFTSSAYAAHFSPNGGLVNVGVRDYSSPNNPEFVDSGSQVLGTGTTEALPGNVAFCVTLRTARAGHSYLGRVYLPGWIEGDNAATGSANTNISTISVAFVTAVQSAMTSNGLTLGVLSRPSDQTVITKTVNHSDGTTSSKTKTLKARPGAITPVTVIQARNNIWDSQRRRTSAGSGSTLLQRALASYNVETGESWGPAYDAP